MFLHYDYNVNGSKQTPWNLMFLHYDYNVDWTFQGTPANQGKGTSDPEWPRARKAVFCMLHAVWCMCLWCLGAECCCCLLPAAAARNLMFLHYDHNVDWTRDTPEPDVFTL